MHAIKKAKQLIAEKPLTDEAKALADLVVCLESGEPFALARLYEIDIKAFELAIRVIEEWRLARYHGSKLKLLDMSIQANALNKETAPLEALTSTDDLTPATRTAKRSSVRSAMKVGKRRL